MTTSQRAAINRQNAQNSTGPNTPAGKQRSALNATRHGLTGQVVVMPTDDLAAYTRFVGDFHAHLHPEGPVEVQLVQMIADLSWRLNRAAAYETNLLSLAMQDSTLSVAGPAQVQSAFDLAQAADKQSKALANISIYSQRAHRQLERTLDQLRQIQSERREREQLQKAKAVSLLRAHKHRNRADANNSLPYNPQADGFVFTLPELESALALQDRVGHAFTFSPLLANHPAGLRTSVSTGR